MQLCAVLGNDLLGEDFFGEQAFCLDFRQAPLGLLFLLPAVDRAENDPGEDDDG